MRQLLRDDSLHARGGIAFPRPSNALPRRGREKLDVELALPEPIVRDGWPVIATAAW